METFLVVSERLCKNPRVLTWHTLYCFPKWKVGMIIKHWVCAVRLQQVLAALRLDRRLEDAIPLKQQEKFHINIYNLYFTRYVLCFITSL